MRAVLLVSLALASLGATWSLDWTLYLRRAGPVVYGMTVAEAERAAGVRLVQTEEERYGCTYVQPEGDRSIAFMVQDGVVVRADVSSWEEPPSAPQTASGIGLGSTAGEVWQAYGDRISERPHPYDGDGGALYLTYTPRDAADADYLAIFSVWQDTVRAFRSGFAENVGLIEGCS